MASYVKYETFVENLANKLIDAFGTTDTWRAVIHTDAPTVATDNALSDLTEISTANGYTGGGENITFNSTRSGATLTATAVDVVWTAVTGNLGNSTTGRYFSIYDDTSAGNNLLASYDYAATFTVAAGETMTLGFWRNLVHDDLIQSCHTIWLARDTPLRSCNRCFLFATSRRSSRTSRSLDVAGIPRITMSRRSIVAMPIAIVAFLTSMYSTVHVVASIAGSVSAARPDRALRPSRIFDPFGKFVEITSEREAFNAFYET